VSGGDHDRRSACSRKPASFAAAIALPQSRSTSSCCDESKLLRADNHPLGPLPAASIDFKTLADRGIIRPREAANNIRLVRALVEFP